MDVVAHTLEGIISPFTNVTNLHTVHLKLALFFHSYIPVKLGKKFPPILRPDSLHGDILCHSCLCLSIYKNGNNNSFPPPKRLCAEIQKKSFPGTVKSSVICRCWVNSILLFLGQKLHETSSFVSVNTGLGEAV